MIIGNTSSRYSFHLQQNIQSIPNKASRQTSPAERCVPDIISIRVYIRDTYAQCACLRVHSQCAGSGACCSKNDCSSSTTSYCLSFNNS